MSTTSGRMVALTEGQHESESETFSTLMKGEPTTLLIHDPEMLTTRHTPLPRILFLTPLGVYTGEITTEIVVGLQGGGCQIVNLNDLKVETFWRIGLTAKAARLLISELKRQLNS